MLKSPPAVRTTHPVLIYLPTTVNRPSLSILSNREIMLEGSLSPNMGVQTRKIIRLSMEFFPPPAGNVSVKRGFFANTPIPITEPDVEPVRLPNKICCIFSESTSHSMATKSILEKVSGKFPWLDGTTKVSTLNPNTVESYFFTSALGDAYQEDYHKGNIITPQLEIIGTLDLYFTVDNSDSKSTGRVNIQHHFHLSQVLVVEELFPNQPSLTAESAARFELCLGQDFFQTYPHLLFEFTPSPACDILISPIHMNYRPEVHVNSENCLCLYAAGVCTTTSGPSHRDTIIQGGFGVYFTRESVYNTFHHLPALRSGVKDQEFHKDGLAAGFGNAPPKEAPTKERADLASLVLSMEMVMSLHLLGHSFEGVKVYHNSDYFNISGEEARTRHIGAGLLRPNNVLIHKLFLLRAIIEDPNKCGLGEVEFLRVRNEEIMPAIRLAELGAQMWAFTGSMTFVERCLPTDCKYPTEPIGNQVPSPSDLSDPTSPSTSNIKFDFATVEKDAPRQTTLQSEPGQSHSASISTNVTTSRSRRGSLSRQSSLKLKGKAASRVPMFLNYGSTITYVSQGKLVAFTPRGLFLLDKERAKIGLGKLESDTDISLDGASEGFRDGGRGNMAEKSHEPGETFPWDENTF